MSRLRCGCAQSAPPRAVLPVAHASWRRMKLWDALRHARMALRLARLHVCRHRQRRAKQPLHERNQPPLEACSSCTNGISRRSKRAAAARSVQQLHERNQPPLEACTRCRKGISRCSKRAAAARTESAAARSVHALHERNQPAHEACSRCTRPDFGENHILVLRW